MKTLIAIFAAAVLGCTSLERSHTMLFVDDNGNVIKVDYERSVKEYVSKVTSPFSGKEIDFRTKLRVGVTMPDGYRFAAWETLNILGSGTLYKSPNERWLYHARGITSSIYEQTIDKSDYKLVYEGVTCSSNGVNEKDK